MPITVCIAGATGWTGSAVARRLLTAPEFQVVGAIARSAAGKDQTHGSREARGATIGGTQIHSVRLPGFVMLFGET